MSGKTGLIIALFGLGILGIVLSIPLLLDKVPPNRVYGFRTARTLSDPAVWYQVNRYVARDLMAVGVVTVVLAIGLFIYRTRLPGFVVPLVIVAAATGLSLVPLVRGLKYAGELTISSAEWPEEAFGNDKIKIGEATLTDVIAAYGEPESYLWGDKRYTKDTLPETYITEYPDGFQIVICGGTVNEIRYTQPGYRFRDKIQVGSPLAEVLTVVGKPKQIVQGQENKFEDGVLYKDINGQKGYDYLAVADLGARLFFRDDKVSALYLTGKARSSSNGGNPGKIVMGLVFLVWGGIQIILSVPLLMVKVPPNGLYGVRIEKTLSNPDVWYKVNKYFAKDFLIAGIGTFILTWIWLFLPAGLQGDTFPIVFLLTLIVFPVVCVVKTLIYCYRLPG